MSGQRTIGELRLVHPFAPVIAETVPFTNWVAIHVAYRRIPNRLRNYRFPAAGPCRVTRNNQKA